MTRARGVAEEHDHASDPTAYWDAVARRNDADVPPLWRLHADLATLALLARWLPAGRSRRILKTDLYDETCSDGLVPVLAARAAHVAGIDVSPLIAATAARRSGATAIVGDVRHLPLRDGAFDVVVSNSTLDHFADHAQIATALRELRRVIAPGGVLVVTLDNPGHPLVRLRNRLAPLLRRAGVVPYAVGVTHGRDGLRHALEDAGFAVAELGAVHHFPRVVVVGLERALGGRGMRGVLRVACAAERLAGWPTRWWTGQYVAALARVPRDAAAPRD
jgi:SAM-dependent methyltransferase